jgi:hypothetical protein
MNRFCVGQIIEVIDARFNFPLRGEILELDEHPLDLSYAKIRVQSPCDPAPEEWVCLRLAKAVQ